MVVNLQLVVHERLNSAFLRCVICPVDFVPCKCWLLSSHFHWANISFTPEAAVWVQYLASFWFVGLFN